MADRGCNRAETWREEKMVRGREAQRELKREREGCRGSLEAQKRTENRNVQRGFPGGKLYPVE